MPAGRVGLIVLFVAVVSAAGGYFAGKSAREKDAASAGEAPRRTEDKVPPATAAPAPDPRDPSVPGSAAPSSPPVAASSSPVARLLAELLPKMSDKALRGILWNAALNDAALQRDVFNLLMASEDPALLEIAQDLLIAIKDPALLNDVLSAFESETLPARRLALAYVLGANWKDPGALPTVMEILGGSDAALQARALTRPCLQNFGYDDEDIPGDVAATLRRLAVHGGSDDVRAKATRAMRGAQSESDVKFLIDLMKRDPSPEVRHEAMWALPVTWSTGSEFEDEMVRALVEVALDASSPAGLRADAAEQALQEALRGDDLLTEAERARLKDLVPPKK